MNFFFKKVALFFSFLEHCILEISLHLFFFPKEGIRTPEHKSEVNSNLIIKALMAL